MDVDPSNNSTIFEVKGYHGESTAGYWYTAVNNRLVLDNDSHTYPYRNVGVRYQSSGQAEPEELTLPVAPAEGEELRYEVSGSLRRDWFKPGERETIQLPVKGGVKIVAIGIGEADSGGERPAVSLKVTRDSVTGVYSTTIGPDDLVGLKRPTLRYWLGSAPDQGFRAVGPMEIFDPYADGIYPLSEAITPDHRVRVARALGLSPDASDQDLRAAIAAKDYSFMPLRTAGERPTAKVDHKTAKASDVLTTIAEGYGALGWENCTSSVNILVTATGGVFDGRNVNVASGVLDNGDGKLNTLESHAWAVDDAGKIIDPTPPGSSATLEAKPGKSLDGRVVVSLLTAAAAGGLWHRRRDLRRFTSRVIDGYYDAKLDDEKTVDDLRTAISILGYLQFAPPSTPPHEWRDRGPERPIQDLLAAWPRAVAMPYSVVEEELSQRGVDTTPGVRSALKELVKPHSRVVRAAARRKDNAA